jgi:hypothetical protein
MSNSSDQMVAKIGTNSQNLVISTGDALPTTDVLNPIDWSSSKNPKNTALTIPVSDQKQCGNCWAMSSTNVLTQRTIIQSILAGNQIGNNALLLQPAVTTQCTPDYRTNLPNNKGCDGGSVYYAGKYLENSGGTPLKDNEQSWDSICEQECPPKTFPSCSTLQSRFSSTPVKAKSGSTSILTAAKDDASGDVDIPKTIINIKRALLGGPVLGQFFCSYDFLYGNSTLWASTNGIYINGMYNTLDSSNLNVFDRYYKSHSFGRSIKPSGYGWADIDYSHNSPSAHAVEIVGWDRDSTFGDYWIIKNSWGPNWNGNGYFKYGMYGGGQTLNFLAKTNFPNNISVPNNSYIALDVPVSSVIKSSTNTNLQIIRQQGGRNVNDLFGGAIYFEPKTLISSTPNYIEPPPDVPPSAPAPPPAPPAPEPDLQPTLSPPPQDKRFNLNIPEKYLYIATGILFLLFIFERNLSPIYFLLIISIIGYLIYTKY